jgi:hypothetical protein
MPATSDTLLPSSSHSLLNSNAISLYGEKVKGDGYYGWGDGYHTTQIQTNNFIGSITIQGSLATDPSSTDWVDIPLILQDQQSTVTTIIHSSTNTSVSSYNFIGNFVWVRAAITNWTQGSINKILLNH